MLFVFYGTDTDTRQDAVRELVDNDLYKAYELITFNDLTAKPELLTQYFESTSLFGEKYLVILDGTMMASEVKEYILSNLETIVDSPAVCVISEETISAAERELFKKNAKLCAEYALPKERNQAWTPFAFTERVGMRDKKGAWAMYTEALLDDKSPDEIIGALFWLLKTVSLLTKLPKGAVSGLNPYVEKKSRSYMTKYTNDELFAFRQAIVQLYHDARRGTVSIDEGLEAILLAYM